jgi:CubicO group peptidase (beta-lactamase class C family)
MVSVQQPQEVPMFSRHTARVIALLILVTISSIFTPAGAGNDPASQLAGFMDRLHSRGQFHGSILVAKDGEVIYRDGFGMANIESSVPNEPGSRFIIGSITKTFTAVMIMQLAEAGKLGLDDPVTKHLPWYPAETGDHITIRHLLNHRSGIPNYMRDIAEFRGGERYAWFRHFSPRELIDIFSGLDLKFEPGERFEYCNSGFYLLGAIIEEVTGMTFGEALQAMILEPAGMDETGFFSSYRDIVPNRARGYYDVMFEGFRNGRYIDPMVLYSAGGMHSTVDDLFLYDRALRAGRLLDDGSREQMLEALFRRPGSGTGYGLGWTVGKLFIDESVDSIGFYGHAGDGPGYFGWLNSYEDGTFIAFLTNTNTHNIFTAGEILVQIQRILHGLPWEAPPLSIARTIHPVIMDRGIEAGIGDYRRLKKESPGEYIFTDSELNRLGYHLLRRGMTEEALEIFRLNVEEYPDVANVYDSLGEAYMNAGDDERAIENYEKVLELDPGNGNASEMLEKLRKE